MYGFVCKFKKKVVASVIIFLSLIIVLLGCQNKEDTSPELDDSEVLIVSVFDNDGKGSVVEINTEKRTENVLVSNEDVWLHATLSGNRQYLSYISAKGDGPWDTYLLDRNNKKTYQVTNDKLGQIMPRFGDKEGNTIYSGIIGAEFPVAKIEKINVETKDFVIFDTAEPDRAVEKYDIFKDKIIGAFVSEKENMARWEAANADGGTREQIDYSIYDMNLDGTDMNLVTKIKAVTIDSIAYGPNGDTIILGGENIDKGEGSGIYQFNLTNKTLTTILTNQMIKESKNPILSEIGQARLAVMSKNEQFIYFAGIPKNAKEVKFDGITTTEQYIYRYDLDNKEITKVYEHKKLAFITDLTVTY